MQAYIPIFDIEVTIDLMYDRCNIRNLLPWSYFSALNAQHNPRASEHGTDRGTHRWKVLIAR